jgi:hypothetical protein
MAVARFMRKGKAKFYFVPTIVTKATPTVAEMTAGTNLSPQVAAVTGFEFANSPIQVPDFANTFTSQIAGEDTAADSNMEFYELTGGTDTVHDALPKGTAGYIVIFYAGTAGASPANADKCEVWPVVVSSNARMYTADNEAAKYRVNYSITDTPVLSASVIT